MHREKDRDELEKAGSAASMRPFWILWGGQALSLVGSQSVQFALIWWLTVESGSATVLALATFLGLVPQVALGPFIGTLVDRWNRKTVMFMADAAVAGVSLVLAVAFAAGQARMELVLLILLARALGGAFHAPAMTASTSLMVPDRHLTRIQGLNQSLQGGLSIVAAPMGALLITTLPMAGVMLVDVGSALFALVPLVFVAVPRQVLGDDDSDGSPVRALMAETRAGFAYLRSRAGHLRIVMMGAVTNLCLVPAFALLPLLVANELGGSAVQLSWMYLAFGLGMLAGGILLGAWGGFRKRILTTLAGLLGLGLAVLLLAVPGATVGLALAALGLVGFMVPLTNGPIQAILQSTVPSGLQGRVFSLVGSLAGATAPLGLLLAAPVADLMGVRFWYGLAGALCLLMVVAGLMSKPLLQIESGPPREGRDDAVAEPA